MRAWKFESALKTMGFIYNENTATYEHNGEEFDDKEALQEIAISENLCIAFSEEMLISDTDTEFENWEEDICFSSKELEGIYDKYC